MTAAQERYEKLQISLLQQHNRGKKPLAKHQSHCRYCRMLAHIDAGMTFHEAWNREADPLPDPYATADLHSIRPPRYPHTVTNLYR